MSSWTNNNASAAVSSDSDVNEQLMMKRQKVKEEEEEEEEEEDQQTVTLTAVSQHEDLQQQQHCQQQEQQQQQQSMIVTTLTHSLPRDCIYSILPFLTLKEMVCTSVLLSHEWYSSAVTLRSMNHHSTPEFEGLTTTTTHLLLSSLLRHHVAHLTTKGWRADENPLDDPRECDPHHVVQMQVNDDDGKGDGNDGNGNGNGNTRSLTRPLSHIAKLLPHLISLTFGCQIHCFDETTNVPVATLLPRIFPPQLRSLKLRLKFDEFEYSPRTWKYVEHLFELVSQQLSHSLIIFHCTINEIRFKGNAGPKGKEKRALIFSADILRHLIPMKELRTLMLYYHQWFNLSESAIDCLRAIPNLTELDGMLLEKQQVYLLREPNPPQFTRLGGNQGYPCGRTINLNRDEAELNIILPALGRMLTHVKLISYELSQTPLFMHFTAVKFMEIFLASDNLDVESLVQAFSKSTQLERLSLDIHSKTIVGLPDGLTRILSGLLKLTHLRLRCYSSAYTDLTFLCSVPHLVKQLVVLSLHRWKNNDIVEPWSLEAYRLIYSFTQLTHLHIFDLTHKKALDSMFRPALQLICSYDSSKGDIDPLPSGPGQLPVGHLPHLTYFSQSLSMEIHPSEREHEMHQLKEVCSKVSPIRNSMRK